MIKIVKSKKYFLVILGIILIVGAGFYFWQVLNI